ncbi:unnamed protein product [Cyclocybe aegerita]|uniref:AAA+ ATPase domain-containing protein n=1 Tax=Cyclocybe aegerita TaxID=1973307 RepID=A0A8S0WPD3_CYCAE|nr:unnamed protein product [Cyclocybe aegerita]
MIFLKASFSCCRDRLDYPPEATDIEEHDILTSKQLTEINPQKSVCAWAGCNIFHRLTSCTGAYFSNRGYLSPTYDPTPTIRTFSLTPSAMDPPSQDPRRKARLTNLFNSILHSETAISPSNGARFLESIYSQDDPSVCMGRVVGSPAGFSALQSAIRYDLSSTFLNTHASFILQYLQHPDIKAINNGMLLEDVLIKLVEPPIFWIEFRQAFLKGDLDENATTAFAWLLLQLCMLPEKASTYQKDPEMASFQKRFLSSPVPKLKSFGLKIKDILDTCGTEIHSGHPLVSAGPGGRHDNDFVDFRRIAILPTWEEMECKTPPFLQLASVLEDPETEEFRVAIHLDNQFRLLREDMIHEMREEVAIATGKKKGYHRGVKVQGLELKGVECDKKDRPDKKVRPDQKARPDKWGLVCICKEDFPQLAKIEGTHKRKEFLTEKPNFFKHQSLACLLAGKEVVAFPSISRDEDRLAKSPPEIILQFEEAESTKRALLKFKMEDDVALVQINTAVFAFEPILKSLQQTKFLPLSSELLMWKKGSPLYEAKIQADPVVRQLRVDPGSNLRDILGTAKDIKLDPSQAASLVSGLTQSVSLIQGPPGTGKSFIGALIAKAIHDHTQQTILVVCYTNHALDDILTGLLDIGIPQSSMLRLGGKSTARTEPLTIFNQPRGPPRTKSEWSYINGLEEQLEDLRRGLETSFKEYKTSTIRFGDILGYLEFDDDDDESTAYLAAFTVPKQEDGMNVVGQNAGVFARQVTTTKDGESIWQLPLHARKAKLEQWEDALLQESVANFVMDASEYNRCQTKLERARGNDLTSLLLSKRIVGCTTTAAAKYRNEIRAFNPDVLLVEEAGEILESHVLTSLGPQTSQMILIGDHKQLRPKVNNYQLTVEKEEGFDLNRSLFERLILKDYPHTSLSQQHRMRPEISALIRHLTYRELVDAPTTQNRPNIKGVQDNIVFLDHDWPEDENKQLADRNDMASTTSKQNSYEISMILKIVKYLAQQGYGTGELVVLTPYLGQLQKLREALKKDNDPILNDLDSHELIQAGIIPQSTSNPNRKNPIRLATIDNYQGEESDIVIVSLTRSNPSFDIGFMFSPERLNVLLSRARNALIMLDAIAWVIIRKSNGPPLTCHKCERSKKLAKEQQEREAAAQERRDAEQKAHLEQMDSLNAAIEQENRRQQDERLRSERAHVLEQKRRDLEILQESRATTTTAPSAESSHAVPSGSGQPTYVPPTGPQSSMAAAPSSNLQNPDGSGSPSSPAPTPSSSGIFGLVDKMKTAVSSALSPAAVPQPPPQASTTAVASGKPFKDLPESKSKLEWIRQKQMEGAQNDAIDAIMEMTGLEAVKEQVLAVQAKINVSLRQNTSLKQERFNVVLLGNPGTGKTTIARHYAKFLASVKAIPGNEFEEKTGAQLAQEGVAETQKLVDKVTKAGGGAIFIDEAYQLTSGNNPGGAAVLDYLLAEMENRVGTLVFILAGYNREMEKFFEHNPGLKSRVPYEFNFADYKDEELMSMLESMVNKFYSGKMKVEGGVKGLYGRIAIRRLGRRRGHPGFGNARDLQGVFSKIRERQAVRITKERKEGKLTDDFLLLKDDIIGLARRFKIEDAFQFEDFSDTELQQIMELKLKKQDLGATDEAKHVAIELLRRMRNRPNFGNAGEVENLIVQGKTRCLARRQKLTPAERPVDVIFEPGDFDPDYKRSENASANLTKLFSDIVGHSEIIQRLRNYQEIANTCKARGMDARDRIPTNFIFTGPPGTGKTTVARKIGQVFYDMGLLSSDEVVECSASDLVGQYVGQTGPKTRKLFEKALGKVLFVDEAYRLSEGHFAQEAIDELVGLLTHPNFKSKLVIILAGYEADMQRLMAVNTGLSSRFPDQVVFENMSADYCLQVVEKELRKNNVEIIEDGEDEDSPVDVEVELKGLIEDLSQLPDWGNARDMMTFCKELINLALLKDSALSGSLNLSGRDIINVMEKMVADRQRRTMIPRNSRRPAPQLPEQTLNPNPPTAPSVSVDVTSQAAPPTPPPRSPAVRQGEIRAESPSTRGRKNTAGRGRGRGGSNNVQPQQRGNVGQQAQGVQQNVQRDPGVTDAEWEQLNAAKREAIRQESEAKAALAALQKKLAAKKKAEEAEKKRLRELEKAQAEARDAARRAEIERQKEEARRKAEAARRAREKAAAELRAKQEAERRRKEEDARAQQKLRQLGRCSAGFEWIRRESYYQCSAGGHTVSISELGL